MSQNTTTVQVEHNIKDDNGKVVKTVSLEVPQCFNVQGAVELLDGLSEATLGEDGNFLERKRGRLADGESEIPWSVSDVINAFLRNRAKGKYTDPVETRMKIQKQMAALEAKLAKLG